MNSDPPQLSRKFSTNLQCSSHDLPLDTICLSPSCQSSRLTCSQCSHSDHQTMHYNLFVNLCQDRAIQLKTLQTTVSEILKESEAKHIEKLNRMRDFFDKYIQDIIGNVAYPFFNKLNEDVNSLINPDIIQNSITLLSESFIHKDLNEINNLLDVITQNLAYSDDQLGLQLRFGPGLYSNKVFSEINNLTEAVNLLTDQIKIDLDEKIKHFYDLTAKKIEKINEKLTEKPEKVIFSKETQYKILPNIIPIEDQTVLVTDLTILKPNLLAISQSNGRIRIYNEEKGIFVKTFMADELGIFSLLYLKENNSLISAGVNLKSFNCGSNFSLQTMVNLGNKVVCIKELEDEKLIVCLFEKNIRLFQYNLIKLLDFPLEDQLNNIVYINSLNCPNRLIISETKGSLYFLEIVNNGESIKRLFKTGIIHKNGIIDIHPIYEQDLIMTIANEIINDEPIAAIHDCQKFNLIKRKIQGFNTKHSEIGNREESLFSFQGNFLKVITIHSGKELLSLDLGLEISKSKWNVDKKTLNCVGKKGNQWELIIITFE